MNDDAIQLICLPFAGGSSYSYKVFESLLSKEVRMVPVEIPGRGRRITESLYTGTDSIVEDIFHQISGSLHLPYAIYGHSMGTLLGYLLTKRILEAGLPAPMHLFFSGRGGPSSKPDKEIRYNLPQEAFFDKLRELGGCPDEVLDDPMMMELFEPILRADFEVVETYLYEPTTPFDIPIDVMYADGEDLTEEDVMAWADETTAGITITKFTGHHFFIFSHTPQITTIFNKTLTKYTVIHDTE
jgi:surfactin synthase thioesterase subunit